MKISKRERLVTVPLRLSPKVREEARNLARRFEVSESSIYRTIVSEFFLSNRQLKVDEKSTKEMQ